MGGCSGKARKGNANQLTTRLNAKKSLSTLLIEELDKERSTTTKLYHGSLVSIPTSLISEVGALFEFNHLAQGCAFYRNVMDSVFITAYTALEKNPMHGVEQWRAAVAKHPIKPGCSKDLLKVVFELPERCWNIEWKRARDAVVVSETKIVNLMKKKKNASKDTQGTKGDEMSKSLIPSYTALAEIQEHFNWAVSIVFDALLHDAETHSKLATFLCRYYKTKSGYSSEATVLTFNEEASSSISLESSQMIEGPTATVLEVLRYSSRLEHGELVDAGSNIVLEWASAGLEFLGIHFLLIRNSRSWKLLKREVTIGRRILFEPTHPCPPLLSAIDSFWIGLCASALIPSSFSLPVIPVHLAPSVVSESLTAINASLKSQSLPEIKQLVPHLPNPGRLLSAYAPQLVPMDTSFELSVDQLITVAIMCLGLPCSFPNASSSEKAVLQFDKYVNLATNVLDRSKPEDLYKAVLTSNAGRFLECYEYGFGGRKTNTTQQLEIPRMKYVALAFKETSDIPSIHQLSSDWTSADLHNLAADEFKCDPFNILPYAPVDEHGYHSEVRDPIWKAEIFGHKCAVWTAAVIRSPKGSFHTLSFCQPARRKAPRVVLRELPWNSGSYVIVPAPSALSLRPSVYFGSRECPPSSEPLIPKIFNILSNNVVGVRSARPFHRLLHRFGLSVSTTSWKLWDIMREGASTSAERAVLELISCDIVAAAVKRVVRFHSGDKATALRLGLEREALECLLPSLFSSAGSKEGHESANVKTARSFLMLALWLSLVRAHQHVDIEMKPTTIENLLSIVSKSSMTFSSCLMDRCSIYVTSNVFFSTLPDTTKDTLSIVSSQSLQFRAYQSMSEPLERHRSCSTAVQLESMSPLNLKIISTFPSCDFIHRCLLVKAAYIKNLGTLRALCFSLEFVNCYPPTQITASLTIPSNAIPPFDFLSSQLTSSYLLALIPNIKKGELPMASRLEAILRVCLCCCLDCVIMSFAGRHSSKWQSEANRILFICSEYFRIMKDRAVVDILCNVLCLRAFLALSNDSNVDSAIFLFHNALRLLLHVFGDPSDKGCRGAPQAIYISWMLSHMHRLLHKSALSRWYEDIFRSARLSVPYCPLSIAPPFVSEKNSQTLTSDQHILAILQQDHQRFTDSQLNWLLAINSSNGGYEFIDFYSQLDVLADLEDSTEHNEVEPSIFPLATPDSALLSAAAGAASSGKIFSLGSNQFGSLGLGPPAFPNSTDGSDLAWTPEPTVVASLKDFCVETITSGASHCIALTDDRVVLAWGDNRYGQVGAESVDLHKSDECPISDLTWSSHNLPEPTGERRGNKSVQNGKTTNNATPVSTICPIAIHLSFNIGIRTVTCGLNFSAAVGVDGSLFTWGHNSFGQLGHGDYLNRNRPTLVESLSKSGVNRVSCGYYHMGIIASNGTVYMWGRGAEGQLGLSIQCFGKLEEIVSAREEYSSWDTFLTSQPVNELPTQQPRLKMFQPGNVLNLSKDPVGCCSTPQLLGLYEFFEDCNPITDERIQAMGWKEKMEYVTWRRDPQSHVLVACIPGSCINNSRYSEELLFLELSCGCGHTLGIDISNYVWVWGQGDSGELGLGPLDTPGLGVAWKLIEPTPTGFIESTIDEGSYRYTPCRLNRSNFNEERILEVFSGRYTSAASDEKHALWCWGSNKDQGLAVTDEFLNVSMEPTRATLFDESEIIFYSAGWSGNRFGAIDSNGSVTLWGVEFAGCLGVDYASADEWKMIPTIIHQTPLKANLDSLRKSLGGRTMNKVSLGLHHTLLRTSSTIQHADE